MRSKINLVIFCVVLLLIPTLACAVDDNALASTNAVATRVTALEAWRNEANAIIATTKAALDTKASKADLDALKAAPATSGYTKAEIDAMIKDKQDKIDALTTKINQWTTGTGSQSPGFGQPTPNPYGGTVPTSPTGQVTWSTNPTSLPQIFAGAQGITANNVAGTPGTTGAIPPIGNISLAAFNVTPTGYVQPYTMRIINNSSAIQYVKPVITLAQSTMGGYYYGGVYPQVIYYNLSISTGLGMVQGTGVSNFFTADVTKAGYYPAGTTCTNAFNGYCPSATGTFTPATQNSWILQNGWWLQSQTNVGYTAAGGTGTIGGAAFPINLSPSNANVQPTPSFTLTTTAPALNGYGEFQMTPGQTMDVLITLQVATLQQCTLTITNSISFRQ